MRQRQELIKELMPLLKDIADYGEEYFEKHCSYIFDKIIAREREQIAKVAQVIGIRLEKTSQTSLSVWQRLSVKSVIPALKENSSMNLNRTQVISRTDLR